jgi:glycerophosphoryl diester phosphodiesterase
MPAFQGAIDLGYRYLETDLHVTADGKVVVFHDDHLDDLTDGTGEVWNSEWAHLATLDAAYWFDPEHDYPLRGTGTRIPLFADAVAAFPDALWNLDLKQRGIEQTVADEVARLHLEERVLIASFHDSRIRRFRRATGGRVATSAGPRETAGALAAATVGRIPRGPADAFQVPEDVGPLKVAGRRFVDAVHRAGKQVHVWTVNDAVAMNRLLDLGVDGIVTSRPDLLNEVLKGREAA